MVAAWRAIRQRQLPEQWICLQGLGGVCMGLRRIVEPILHCDISGPCRAVLKARMEDGTISACPTVGDIKELTFAKGRWAEEGDVEVILSSWPCTGLSPMGKMQGFQDHRSALFYEVMRIIDETRSPVIFFENVPNVLKLVMEDVVHELSTLRGYDLRWVVIPASAVGAQHVRERWFCLATLPGYRKTWKHLTYEPYDWSMESQPPRMIKPGDDPHRILRCGFAGNAVVPDCVRPLSSSWPVGLGR